MSIDNMNLSIEEFNNEHSMQRFRRLQAYYKAALLVSADNCVEVHALCSVLKRYDIESQNHGMFSLRHLKDNYGDKITKDQLVEHLMVVEEYFHINNHSMANMFDLVLARIDTQFLKSLFTLYVNGEPDTVRTSRSLFYGDTSADRAPQWELVALETKLFDFKSDASILDPFSGYARLLNEAFSTDDSEKDTPLLYFQDKDPIALGMACANSIIYKSRLGGISCDDSLRNVFQNRMTFDYIFINRRFTSLDPMPYNIPFDLDTSSITDYPETIPFAQALKYMSPTGQAMVLCSTSTLYKKTSKVSDARAELIEKNCIKAIIQLPTFFVKTVAGALVIMTPWNGEYFVPDFYEHGTEPVIRMIDGAAYAKWRKVTDADENFINALVDLYRHGKTGQKGSEAFVKDVTLSAIVADSNNLCPSHYIDTPTENTGLNKTSLSKETEQLIADSEEIMLKINESHEAFREISEALLGF